MSPEQDLAWRLTDLHRLARHSARSVRVRVESNYGAKYVRPCRWGRGLIEDVIGALDEAAEMLERIALERRK